MENIYGKEYKAVTSDELGVLIISTLQKKTAHVSLKPPKGDNLVPYTISVSMSYFGKHGCHIFDRDRSLIAKTIDRWFRHSLYRAAIINQKMFNIDYKDTFEGYLKNYNIPEDELNYSTIRRDFNRKKKDIEDLLNSHGTKKIFSSKKP